MFKVLPPILSGASRSNLTTDCIPGLNIPRVNRLRKHLLNSTQNGNFVMASGTTCEEDVSNKPGPGIAAPKQEIVLENTPGKQVAIIPSLSQPSQSFKTMSNSLPKKEVKMEAVESSQSMAYDYKMIANAQRRHTRIVERIETALDEWQPTIHAGSSAGTAIERPASVPIVKKAAQQAQTTAEDPTSAQTLSTQEVEDTYIPDMYQEAAISAAEAGESFFLTGSAGTGKSYVLKKIIKMLRAKGKEVAVTASTGCAAVAINGGTVHSATCVGLGMDPPEVLERKARKQRRMREMLNSYDVLVLDEVSMIDSFLFDKIELVFSTARAARNRESVWSRKKRRANREQESRPFGGVQVIVCGDFFQLPPVAASDYELQYTNEKYFAFESKAWKRTIKKTIMLRVVHRQSDVNFVGLLNEIRHGVVSDDSSSVLEACHINPNQESLEIKPNGDPLHFTKLFSHRKQVDMENYSRLHKIRGYPGIQYIARDVIEENELRGMTRGAAQALLNNVPGLDITELKERCRVLCLKNIDTMRGIVNGSTGYVVGFSLPDEEKQIGFEEWEGLSPKQRQERYEELANKAGLIKKSLCDKEMQEKFQDAPRDSSNGFMRMDGHRPGVLPVVRFDNGVEMPMVPQKWEVYGVQGQVVAWRSQIPVTLGWALSIHKSQGMSLSHVQTELARAFDFGQVYVAISRATSVQGLRLTSFDRNRVMTHEKVVAFYARVEQADARQAAKRRRMTQQCDDKDIIEVISPQ